MSYKLLSAVFLSRRKIARTKQTARKASTANTQAEIQRSLTVRRSREESMVSVAFTLSPRVRSQLQIIIL